MSVMTPRVIACVVDSQPELDIIATCWECPHQQSARCQSVPSCKFTDEHRLDYPPDTCPFPTVTDLILNKINREGE